MINERMADPGPSGADQTNTLKYPEIQDNNNTNSAPSQEKGKRSHSATSARDITLPRSSDVATARDLKRRLEAKLTREVCPKSGEIVYSEGKFWAFDGARWQAFPDHKLRQFGQFYDGARYLKADGSFGSVKITSGRIDSILKILAANTAKPRFFECPATGINCSNGFVSFDDDGQPTLVDHGPNHRLRHEIDAEWNPSEQFDPAKAPLLSKFLDGIFKGDHDAELKARLLAEVAGVALLGYATDLVEPKAIVLHGPDANNGKSETIKLLRRAVPQDALASIPLRQFGNSNYLAQLNGAILNTADELDAKAVTSDAFKQVVTGEPITADHKYERPFTFRPRALNVFATNVLPPFAGGMDAGVRRRLLVIPFNRIIPEEERIPGLADRIWDEEGSQLVAWAVEGASRVLRQGGFTKVPDCNAALRDWLQEADPIQAYFEERIEEAEGAPPIRTREVYEDFLNWYAAEGYNPAFRPNPSNFARRLKAASRGIGSKRTREGRFLVGLRLRQDDRTRHGHLREAV